jgi:two-component system, OmpR family, response regulator
VDWSPWLIFVRVCQLRMRLLLVEDEPDLLSSLAQALREDGYAVDTAVEGKEGLDKALNSDYDVVLLDVMLPGLDGWEILAQIRQVKKTPVLLLTARDQSCDRVRGLDAGADDYVIKPFDLPELLARVRSLIRRHANGNRPIIETGGVTIQLAARTVSFAGREVTLTAREYALVEYLALHRGEVIARSVLYNHLFDEDDDTLSNLLDVHVSNVRKKICPTFILTHRGHGYSIPE